MKVILKTISILFFLIICSQAAHQLSAQSPDQLYKLALQHRESGQYDQAFKAFKRLLFFDENMQYPSVLPELADCSFHLKDFNAAYYYYDLAENQPGSDSLKSLCFIRKVACKLYMKELNEAKLELLSVDTAILDNMTNDYHLLSGITHYSLGEYETARQHFLQIVRSDGDSITYFFARIPDLKARFKPGLAKVMSIIIPGTGQIYAGDWQNGLNSFFLTAGFLSLGAAMMGTLSFVDSAVLVLPWFQRYYTGGFLKAYDITAHRLENELNKNLIQLVGFVERNRLN